MGNPPSTPPDQQRKSPAESTAEGDQLDGLLGVEPAPLLRALPVDLEELAGVIEGDLLSAGGRLDLKTGQV